MREQIAVQSLLREKLIEAQSSNARYSLRAFAKKVGVHVGALSSIMNGRRNVSRGLAERISQRLLLDPQQRAELLNLFPLKRKLNGGDTTSTPEPRYLELSASQFKLISEWEHFAVLSLLNCHGFKSESHWIAERLGISETRARQVIDRLIQLQLLELHSSGSLKRQKKSHRTSDDIATLSLKKCHEQTLDLAKTSLFRDEVKDRDFTSITMAIDPSKISMAKELIRKFQDELSDLLESGKRTEVYRLSMQLFPLSTLESSSKKG